MSIGVRLRFASALTAILAAAVPLGLAAQGGTGTVEGTVTDANSQRPLANVQVTIVGTGATIGAATNAQGTYRIVNVAAGTRTVRARLIGYSLSTQTVNVTGGATAKADFQMKQSAIELSAVVTTGTGGAQMEARKLGNTVASVEVPEHAPVKSFSDALQGREPGVMAMTATGTTGEGATIRIRGNASLSQSNEPIVYVDGIRIDNGGGFGSGFVGTGGGGRPSRLDDIDPTSIEKVEVLKGAAATTLYGTEASAGVILITTKSGSSSAARWSVTLDQELKNYPQDRVQPQWGFAGRQCAASVNSLSCADTVAQRLSYHYGFPVKSYVPFSRAVATKLFETGKASTVTGQVQGGNPLVTYFSSLRAYLEDGPFTAKNYNWQDRGVNMQDINNKYQGTLALGLTPIRTFKLQFNALYANTHNEIPENNNSIYAPFTNALFAKPENAQCDASKTSPTDPTYGSLGNGLCKGPGNPTGNSSFGSEREMLQQTIKQDARHFNGSLRASYIPTAGFNLDGTFGVDFTAQRSASFLPFGNNLDLRINRANQGFASLDDRTNQVLTLSVNGGWNTNPTAFLSSNLIFGAQGFITRTNDESSTNQNFPGPGIEVVGGGNSPQVFENFQSTVNTGYFGQETLGLNDWLFADVGGRYDYNSAFGKTSGGVFYPKASFSMIFSDRAGWKESRIARVLSTFRLRGAIGKAGLQPGAFDKLTTYQPLTSTAGSGLVPANLGNPNLKPEVSTEMEGGAELGFFSDRTSLGFTRWQRTLKDALVARQFPVTGGFQALQLDNIGEMKAWGWDVKLKSFIVDRPNVQADVYVNTSFLSQLVTSLGGAPPLKVGGSYPRYRNFIIQGYAPGTFFGSALPVACPAGKTTMPGGGVCLQPGQVPFSVANNGKPSTEAEMLAFLATPHTLTSINPLQRDDNLTGNKLMNVDGKPLPDFEGSLGGSLSIGKHWRMATNFEYRTGHYTISDLTDAFRTGSPTNGGNTQLRAQTEATMLNPASTAQQRLDAAWTYWRQLVALSPYDGQNQQKPGDFIRWRELSVTYTPSPGLARSMGGQDVSITLAARNFALWTRYPGMDPELNVYGRGSGGGTNQNVGESIDAFGFPIPRAISLNIRVGF